MKQADSKTFGDRLRTWRTHLKMTQVDFAELTGISLVMLKKYEADRASPGAQALTQVSKTGANVDWLLTGEGDMLAEAIVKNFLEGNPDPTSPESIRSRLFSKTAFDQPDPHLIVVYNRLTELAFTPGRLPWLPDGLTVPQLRQLTRFATLLLWEVAFFLPERLDYLLRTPAHIDAALLLGWRQKQTMTGTEIEEAIPPFTAIQIMEARVPVDPPLIEETPVVPSPSLKRVRPKTKAGR